MNITVHPLYKYAESTEHENSRVRLNLSLSVRSFVSWKCFLSSPLRIYWLEFPLEIFGNPSLLCAAALSADRTRVLCTMTAKIPIGWGRGFLLLWTWLHWAVSEGSVHRDSRFPACVLDWSVNPIWWSGHVDWLTTSSQGQWYIFFVPWKIFKSN